MSFEKLHELRDQWKEEGLCIDCGAETEGKRFRCERHQKSRNEYAKEKRKERKKKGLCTECGKKMGANATRLACKECRDKRKKHTKKAYRKNVEQGTCPRCSVEVGGVHVYCAKCRAWMRERNRPESTARRLEEWKLMKNTLECIIETSHPESEATKQARFCLDSLDRTE